MAQTEASRGSADGRAAFAVEWELAEDPHLHWSLDRMHFPDPAGPLTVSFERVCFNRGAPRAFQHFGLPVKLRFQVVNGFIYGTDEPTHPDPAVVGGMSKRARQVIKEAATRHRETWEREILPELEADVAALRAFDYAGASDSELADHLDWVIERRARHWDLHFRTVIPMLGPVEAFCDLYQRVLGAADETEPYVLLQGLLNKTVEGGHALWRLSRLAAKSPDVRKIVEQASPEELFERLEETPTGREFARAFRAYLDEFGWRGDSWNMDDRTWISYPRTPLNTLRGYLAQPDGASPELAHAELARRREAAIAAARKRLADSPPEVRAQFEGLLEAAQFGQRLQEDHNYIIDQMLQHLSRRAFVEAGKRFASRGQIADPEDVIFLTVDEILGQLRASERPDLAPVVEERRAAHSRNETLTPPPTLGAPPPPPEPGRRDRFWGGQPRDSTEREIRGNAGSRGKVTGIARVARSLAEASSLQPGEILVSPTTAPPWTPLFVTAAAIVTDTGGILSHCAVVAREYGIPAVVGTGVATQRIRTGQRITVDGALGVVTLE